MVKGWIGTFVIKGWCHSEQTNIPLEFGDQEWFCPEFWGSKKETCWLKFEPKNILFKL